MNNIPLYDLTASYMMLRDVEGPDEFEVALSQLTDLIEIKAENICLLIRSLELTSEAFSKEASRMRDLASARTNRAARLRKYLLDSLLAIDAGKFPTAHFPHLRIQATPPACGVVNVLDVPPEFLLIPPPVVSKEVAIKWWREHGEEPIPGLEISRSKTLVIG